MNQTRVFLIFAWLAVATLLWMEWGKERDAARAPTTPAAAATTTASGAVPAAGGQGPAVPSATPGMAAAEPAPAAASAPVVTVTTDVLQLEMTGGEIRQADLLGYPSEAADGSAPVRLFDQAAGRYFVARTGWAGNDVAPSHDGGFRPVGSTTRYALAEGANTLEVPFEWTGPNGVTIRRTYTFGRGQYAVSVRDEVANAGSQPWQAYVYRELSREPRALSRGGPMNAEQYSFQGAAWYSDAEKYEKRDFEDIADDGPLNRQVTGGWVAMLQHHFFAGWIPQADQASLFVLEHGNGRYEIESRGPAFTVAPGGTASTEARLWVGPKLVGQIQAQDVPGLDRAVDFSRFSIFATLGNWIFWLLDAIHSLVGNWGWSIIGLVVVIKVLLLPLSTAQYKSMARMRKFQPRIAQLKERYGDDRQKFQMAMMELYKKEKINPVGGCLPLLVQMPVFLALYWVLLESVELRHAPWILWINDLTARDPYFVLPAINMAVMWATQKLAPTSGMDPMQAKMMQFMPLVFGVMFAFFPAGLVLYWITNAGIGLAQQWFMTRKYAEAPAKA